MRKPEASVDMQVIHGTRYVDEIVRYEKDGKAEGDR